MHRFTPEQLAALGIELVTRSGLSFARIRAILTNMERDDYGLEEFKCDLFFYDAESLEFPLGSAQKESLTPHNRIFDQQLLAAWEKQLRQLLDFAENGNCTSCDIIRKTARDAQNLHHGG